MTQGESGNGALIQEFFDGTDKHMTLGLDPSEHRGHLFKKQIELVPNVL